MNIECTLDTLHELESAFKFNDAVLRSLVVKRKEAVTAGSPMMKEGQAESEAGAPTEEDTTADAEAFESAPDAGKREEVPAPEAEAGEQEAEESVEPPQT